MIDSYEWLTELKPGCRCAREYVDWELALGTQKDAAAARTAKYACTHFHMLLESHECLTEMKLGCRCASEYVDWELVLGTQKEDTTARTGKYACTHFHLLIDSSEWLRELKTGYNCDRRAANAQRSACTRSWYLALRRKKLQQATGKYACTHFHLLTRQL